MREIEDFFQIEREPRRKVVLLFPGQGFQERGMGREFYDTSWVRDYDKIAKSIFGHSIIELSQTVTDEELHMTKIAQELVVFWNHMRYLIWDRDRSSKGKPKPAIIAGNSAGEYNALVAAGAISFEDCLRLIFIRGEAMHRACVKNPSGIIALSVKRGLNGHPNSNDRRSLKRVREAGEKQNLLLTEAIISDALVNVGYDKKNEGKVSELISKYKGVKGTYLKKYEGAFHTELMRPAFELFEPALSKIKINRAKIPVVSNVTGTKFLEDPEDIRQELIEHIYKPVQWKKTTDHFKGGDFVVYEIGNKPALLNLLKNPGTIATVAIAGVAIVLYLRRGREEDK